MKQFIFYYILIKLLNLIFSIVPEWNFQKTVIDLLSSSDSYNYTIYEGTMYNMSIKLIKEITRNEGKIIDKNRIYIDNEDKGYVIWEDIESFYNIEGNKYICPKGSYYIQIFSNGKFEDFKPANFDINGNWELKCYYHTNRYLAFALLNNHNEIFGFNLGKNEWYKIGPIFNIIYDFNWTQIPSPKNDEEYPMATLLFDDKNILLRGILMTINNETFSRNDQGSNLLIEAKSYIQAYFNNFNYNFYFMTYNNISDFIIGYYNQTENFDFNDLEKIIPTIKNVSFLQFLDNVTITKMNFIRGTKYIYYEIYNNIKNITYHGLIDIMLNKIIFNTDEEINKFISYSNNSMLVITNDSAYRICAIKYNNDCVDECPNDNIIIDTQRPNYCGKECENITLMPDKICIDSCDENLYILNDTICQLCKDNDIQYKYKLLNTKGCLNIIPDGAYEFDENFHLLKCKEGYYLEGEKCVSSVSHNCHKNCEECLNFSDNDNEQNCTSCNRNYSFVLEEGNCITNCSPNYFETENKQCIKCDSLCLTCYKEADNCTKCDIGKYLNENNKCENCSDNCQTCNKGPENDNQNCLSCKKNSKYIYLIDDENNHNCVEDCPINMTLDDEKNKCIYKTIGNDTNIDKEEESIKKKPNFILMIFIIIIIIFLLIISLCICKKYCNKPKNENNLMEQINTELDDKEIIN